MRRLGPVAQIQLYGSFRLIKGHPRTPEPVPGGRVCASCGPNAMPTFGLLPRLGYYRFRP